MVVTPQQIGDCFFGKSKSVMHPESVWRGALGIAELDLRSNTGQEPLKAVNQIGARFDDSPALRSGQRVSGRLDHVTKLAYASAISSSASGSNPTM